MLQGWKNIHPAQHYIQDHIDLYEHVDDPGAGLTLCGHVREERKRHSPKDIVAKLRQVEALRSRGHTCAEAVQSIGVSEVTYRRWRAEFGGLIRTLGPNHSPVEKPRNT